jgi:hypothetical protein
MISYSISSINRRPGLSGEMQLQLRKGPLSSFLALESWNGLIVDRREEIEARGRDGGEGIDRTRNWGRDMRVGRGGRQRERFTLPSPH